MSFLTPAFLIGISALAIPVLIHLIQRERRRVVEFPSLMFLRRIPYQSVRRRSIRHWLLLLLRAAAILLIVAAFARPFIPRGALAVSAARGAREVVVLLDQSASMGYGDHWQRARDAARKAIDGLSGDDKATLVLFARNAEENVRATSDRLRLGQAIDAAKVTSGSTRYGPALKLAQSILSASSLKQKELVLVSDFQKTGWTGAEEIRLPEGTVMTPVSVASAEWSNVSIPSLAFARASFSGQERITVTAGLVNRGAAAVNGVITTLEVDGHPIESKPVTVGANSSGSVSFAPFTLADANVRGIVRAGTDPLPQDNVFYFVLTPSRPVSVLVVARDPGEERSDSTLYLAKALSIGNTPAFQVDVVSAARMTPASLEKRAVVILNDTPFPPAGSGGALQRFVDQGGGLLVALGEHSTWPANDAALLPGTLTGTVDRPDGHGGALGFLDYSHPVLEVFKAPRSGGFSGTRVFRYRALAARAGSRVLARFDDGALAAAEQRTGLGKVIAWNTTLDDSWSDLAKKPVFLPLVHQLVRYLARYEEPAASRTVGQALDLTSGSILAGSRRDRVVLTPSGRRVTLSAGNGPEFLELDEQGFYELRSTGGAAETRPPSVAVDIEPTESDLSAMDPREFTAALTGRAGPDADRAATPDQITPQDLERRQAIWWYLLLGGILLLATETILSNRISRV